MPRISGSSDEIIRIERPCAASFEMIWWIAALVPTSTPCVGSSRIRIFGSAASHLESATFCWLPPDRLRTTCDGPNALMLSCSMKRRVSARSAPGRRNPSGDRRGSTASDAFVEIDIGWMSP